MLICTFWIILIFRITSESNSLIEFFLTYLYITTERMFCPYFFLYRKKLHPISDSLSKYQVLLNIYFVIFSILSVSSVEKKRIPSASFISDFVSNMILYSYQYFSPDSFFSNKIFEILASVSPFS